jgi:acetylglutamate kinase
MQLITIIKTGGNVIDDEIALQLFLHRFANIPGYKILVHGGGKLATKLAGLLNIPQQMINGRRVTDADTLRIATMVYAGEVNKKIVAGLQALHCNAFGLTGADGNLIQAKKRAVAGIDYGFAGDLTENSINTRLLLQLLETGLVPVIAPITHNKEGQLLNTNADTVAAALSVALATHIDTTLVFCFEKKGVLSDPNDEDSVIPAIDTSYYKELKEQNRITAGMIPKLDNAFDAIRKGVKKVIIGNANELDRLIQQQSGTVISDE